ncbi:YhgE/Pip domain-containing protein [Intestinibacter bartlettii]|uniref:YhgE/Pip domain-containing protein n=1 Tax=Intestinibacter bartlettii TaxID=261299 RepID=A0ABS6DYU1_9FIRM|nr:YhgE/Pip domain-containing protein [Intestinibacter bartlettii]MBU5337012.1 YhgE/Pip domain-containing protein [Intestinibacter bartlettii]
MSKIFKIFYDDIKDIFTNFALLIVILALCILPSLYAWFNILASWDPYGNTGNIPIAVVNNDKGAVLSDKDINVGDQLIKKLKKNDSLGWKFVNSDTAKKGLESGKYYATIEIPSNFSSDLLSIISKDTKKAQIIYSVNEKINAIAPKITDKGASTIQLQVNQTVVKTAGEIVFNLLNDAGIKLEEELPKLTKIETSLLDVKNKFSKIDDTIAYASESIEKMDDVINSLNKNMPLIEETITNASNLSSNVGNFLQNTQNNLGQISPIIQRDLQALNSISASAANTASALIDAINSNYEQAPQLIDNLSSKLNNLHNVSGDLVSLLTKLNHISNNANLTETINKLNSVNSKLESSIGFLNNVKNQIEAGEEPSLSNLNTILTVLNDVNSITSNILNNYDSSIKNPINQIFSQGIDVSENVGDLLKNAKNEIPKVKSLLSSLSGFSENAQDTIALANEKIPQAKTILNDLIDAVSKINNSKDTQDLIDFLRNDVMVKADFLESPVDIVQHSLYPMANYGASMTPFYTTLSLWVGILLLTSLLTTEVHVHNHDLENENHDIDEDNDEYTYKPYQVYLGRGLTFLTIALIQALIVSVGDIFILKVKMDNPFLFVLIALFVGTVFNFIVYSLVSIFGNIGKALCVILLVLQVAGSGGTFPIEVTPKFFHILYPFFPFTYGISAMREAIGGIYLPNLSRDLSVLFVFLAASITINIFLKAPINRLFHKFVSKLENSRLTE